MHVNVIRHTFSVPISTKSAGITERERAAINFLQYKNMSISRVPVHTVKTSQGHMAARERRVFFVCSSHFTSSIIDGLPW